MTDSSAYLLNQVLPASNLAGVMRSLFDRTQGIGISFLRNPMGASDLARTVYSYDDQPAGATDPTLASFSIAHDRADILPLLLMAKSINPEIKMMANPWSPPGWMKTTGSMIGGSLNASAYSALAGYLVKYVQAYAASGVPVDYLSVQNEPQYLPDDYPGMSMSSGEQLRLIRDYVLPAFRAANLTTKVLVYDYNWDVDYPRAVLSDAAVATSPNIGGTAWHWYGGTPGTMTTIHNLHPGLNNYVTEASGGTWIADEVKQDFEMMVHSMRNWASTYVKWGLALDPNHGPHSGGCATCTPLVTIDSITGAVNYPVEYYTLGHFSKFVLPGSVALWSSNAAGVISAAFTTPEGKVVLVAYNDSSASKNFQVSWRGRSFEYALPALAGATFTWVAELEERAMGRSVTAGVPRPVRWPRYAMSALGQIQASSYTQIANLQSEPCSDTDGGFDVGYASDGAWLEFDNIDFGSGAATVDVRWASPSAGAGLEFHLDEVTGPLIAQGTLPATGGVQSWQTFPVSVSGVQGLHRLFVVFRGKNGFGNLNWFRFR
jgi:glucosylceramidase